MLDRLFRIAGLGGGVRRHLVAQGMDVAGATGRLGLVSGASDLGKHLGDRFGNRGLSEIGDRKSTRLNSSHSQISYAVFCLKKKNTQRSYLTPPCRHLI